MSLPPTLVQNAVTNTCSAVFASSFRTWVLFNYSKNDISYTLAPLLVWSDVEMCAGIVSACLPTLRPVVALAFAKLGLERFDIFSRHSVPSDEPGSGLPRSGHSGKEDANNSNSRRSKRESTKDTFYRLPDNSDLEDILVDSGHFDRADKLRGQSKTSKYEVNSLDDGTTEHDIQLETLPKARTRN